MVDEISQVEGPYEVHDFTITTGDAVSGLSIMSLEDPRSIGVCTAENIPFAGILVTDKTATDGRTEAGCYTKGVFKMKAAAGLADSISFGELVTASGQFIRLAVDGELESGLVVGKALQDIAEGGEGEIHVGVVA